MSSAEVGGIDAGHEWSFEDFNPTSPDDPQAAGSQATGPAASEIPAAQPFEEWVQESVDRPRPERVQDH